MTAEEIFAILDADELRKSIAVINAITAIVRDIDNLDNSNAAKVLTKVSAFFFVIQQTFSL
ncbi:hypothetical protein A3781_07365 [Bacillus badius]|nr:hypothetical protein A3781_07365 [Bacillus badius]